MDSKLKSSEVLFSLSQLVELLIWYQSERVEGCCHFHLFCDEGTDTRSV